VEPPDPAPGPDAGFVDPDSPDARLMPLILPACALPAEPGVGAGSMGVEGGEWGVEGGD
jgi:hypothetical protein